MANNHHNRTSILIVDDHEVVRNGIRSYLETLTQFNVIGEAYASLRYGTAASRGDDDRERAVALAHLARAVDILPAPAALRAL